MQSKTNKGGAKPYGDRIRVESNWGFNELMDVFRTEEIGRRLATVVLDSAELGRPYLLPPGYPPNGSKFYAKPL
jgi:hypothetical protein